MSDQPVLEFAQDSRYLVGGWLVRALRTCAILVAVVLATPALSQSTVTYQYDTLARLSTATYGSKTITYTFDAAGNRTQVATGATPHFATAKSASKKPRKRNSKKR